VSLILLVEDSRLLRLAYERVLVKAGHRIITAPDGEEALVKAVDADPDLILLDMLLPKLGGPQVLRALRANPVTCSTPVIVLSGLSQKNEARLIHEGATAYLEKSGLEIDKGLEALVQSVKEVLDRAPARQSSAVHLH
jgi:CheY-like chemotaxis protein